MSVAGICAELEALCLCHTSALEVMGEQDEEVSFDPTPGCNVPGSAEGSFLIVLCCFQHEIWFSL